MRKLPALLLAALLLAGCTAEPPEPTTPETTPATEEIVIDYASLELLEFDYENVYAAAPMGNDLLLFSGTGKTTLIKLSGKNHKELALAATDAWIEPDDPAVQVSESGICYAAETALIFLDADLVETDRMVLSDAWRHPVVAADQQTIYYSTGSALRVCSRASGLDRPLRGTTLSQLWLLGLQLDDTVAVCQNLDDDTTLFYSTSTGELLASFDDRIILTSAGDLWLASISDGTHSEWVFGTGSAAPQALTLGEMAADPVLIPGFSGILVQTADDYRFLNLADGTCASITLEGSPFVTNAWSDAGILWFSLNDGRVCRWETDGAAQEAISCIGPYYSRENPDAEGLAALETEAGELENTYGVQIHMAEDAVSVPPDGLTLVSEYRVDALEAGLQGLSAALSRLRLNSWPAWDRPLRTERSILRWSALLRVTAASSSGMQTAMPGWFWRSIAWNRISITAWPTSSTPGS